MISTFFLAMTLFPEAQARAQEEIDRVIGYDRLPTLADRDDLPYIAGVLRETVRWHTPIPCGEHLGLHFCSLACLNARLSSLQEPCERRCVQRMLHRERFHCARQLLVRPHTQLFSLLSLSDSRS